jgi:hypothetical protein
MPVTVVPRKLHFAVAVAAALAVTGGASARPDASARVEAIRFVSAPRAALQGKEARIVIRTSGRSGVCRLSVRYADGATELIGLATATAGRVTWTWRVGEVAAAGKARLYASCTGAGSAARSVTVVGTLVPPKIVVADQGFSVRPKGSSTSVSFGVMLRNESPNADALQVYVLVNFVMADGHLIGSKADTIEAIPAGRTHAHGDSLSFPGAAPVVRLEVVIKVGGRQRRIIHVPVASNVRVVPDRYDATWVGEVNGEIINDHPQLNLQRTELSTVVFDAAGNVLGGGTGSASALLPPGTRQAFAMRSGLEAIPWARAARAVVTPLGTYVP